MEGLFQQFLQQTVNLLQLGSIYGILAVGFSMVYGIARLVNFAHGAIFMIATYLLYFFGTLMYTMTEVTWAVLMFALICASALTALLAVVIEKIAYKPLRNAPKVSVVVSSVGVGMVLEYLVLTFIGPNPHKMPPFVKMMRFKIGGVNINLSTIIIVIVAIVAMIALNLYVKKSKTGVALRAVAEDGLAASFMGISNDRMVSVAFILGAIMATIGASLYGVSYPTFNPYVGDQINWWSFTAAVLGGIGSINGAILGGFLLAAVNVYSPMFLPESSWRNVVAFGVLIIVLMIKPAGLLGKKQIGQKSEIQNAKSLQQFSPHIIDYTPRTIEGAHADRNFAAGVSGYHSLQCFVHEGKVCDPVNDPEHLKWLHVVISNAKTFINGTFHGLSERHLQRYLDEFCYRFNRRKFNRSI